VGAVAGTVAAVAIVQGRLTTAAADLVRERPLPLAIGALCMLLVPHAHAAAWRAVLSTGRSRLSYREAWACYGMGSLANTILPAKLGEPVRIGLFAQRLTGPRPRMHACSASAAVGLAQASALLALLALGALVGAMPLWAGTPIVGVLLAVGGARLLGPRCRHLSDPSGRLKSVAALARSTWRGLLGWIGAAACLRVAAVAAVLSATSAPHPFRNAVVALAAGALGNVLPFAPGGLGVPAAAMAVALGQGGMTAGGALAAAVTFHMLETASGLVFGSTGCLVAPHALRRSGCVAARGAESVVAVTGAIGS
jgi:uncharacterized membrane protein YbhN (UPF0104 family)